MRIALVVLELTTNHFARPHVDRDGHSFVEIPAASNLLERYAGTSTVIGGAIDYAEQRGFELIPAFLMEPGSSPTLTDAELHRLASRICEAIAELAPSPDAIMLRLSGAMRSTTIHAADKVILEQVRARQPGTPLAAVLSPHANVTSELVHHCDVVLDAGFGDPALERHRGARAIDLLAERARGGSFSTGWQSRPMVASLGAAYYLPEAARTLLGHVRAVEERPDVLAVSLFGGFPFGDVPEPHFSVVTLTTDDEYASSFASEIADTAWSLRHELYPPGLNVEAAVHSAIDSAGGPVVLAELGDDPSFGAPGDGTTILWALLDLGAQDAVLGPICDSEAVANCITAGVGNATTVAVGGKLDHRNGYPIDVNGVVTHISEHSLPTSRSQTAGMPVNPGRVVVLKARARHHGSVDIVLTERQCTAPGPLLFALVGVDLHDKQIIVVKSNGRCRHTFDGVATEVIDVVTPGITTTDLAFFDFASLRRPLYPLDEM